MTEPAAELKALLPTLDDYALVLNAGFTPELEAIAEAQAFKKKIERMLDEAEGKLSAETIWEIKRGVELIIEGSNRAWIILENLSKRIDTK